MSSIRSAGELSGSTVALDTLADIDMLADCDALVLVLRSAVSRLSHHLALARRGRPVPLISLQWPTSPGHLKGKKFKKLKGRNTATEKSSTMTMKWKKFKKIPI